MCRIYLEKSVEGQTLRIRDLREDDLEPILQYWFESPRSFLETIGVDVDAIPDRATRERFFRSMIGADPLSAESLLVIGEFEGRPRGYALFNRIRRPDSCDAHVHVFDSGDRHRGLTSAVFLEMVRLIPGLVGVRELVFEPSARNLPVNGLLQKFGLKPVATYLREAQGIVKAMEVNRYSLRFPALTNLAQGD